MVLLIKNKHASCEDILSDSPMDDTPRRRLAKLSMQSLRNAGLPKAKSTPHINLLAEGGSLKARCAAVLDVDLHKLKHRDLIARKVKSAKEDLRRLFDEATPKQGVEPAKTPCDLISTEPVCSASASSVGTFLNFSSSVTTSVPAPLDEPNEDDEDPLHCLAVVAQNWLDSEHLFFRRRTLFDQTIEEARQDFCQALVQSFSDRSAIVPPLQESPSLDNHVDLPMPCPTSFSPVDSPAPSTITLATKMTVTLHTFESMAPTTTAQSPEFSDEDLKRDFDNFSFHSSQEEEWTSEVDSRKQNAINRVLCDMKRKLAVPVPKLSCYLSDDSLADSAAYQMPAHPRAPCSNASLGTDNSSCYSADQEDEAEDNDSVAVSVSPPDSPLSTATFDIPATIVPTCVVEASLSSRMDESTLNEKQGRSNATAADTAEGTGDVWKILAAYVPRPLTRISEESLADEHEIEVTAQSPPPSFRRPVSQYGKSLLFEPDTWHLDYADQVDSMPAPSMSEDTGSSEVTSSNMWTSFAATMDTDSDSSSSAVVEPQKTLRRVRDFTDLKNPAIFPTVENTSSFETICDMISLHEDACSPKSQARRLRRVPGCRNLRNVFGGTIIPAEMPPNFSGMQGQFLHSIQSLGRSFSFKGRNYSSDLGEGCKTCPVSSCDFMPTRKDSAKPSIPPKPPGFYLHCERIRLSSSIVQEPSTLRSRCDPLSVPLWSCAKITGSKGKRGRPLSESTKALRGRLVSIRMDPETIHGHLPLHVARNLHPFSLSTKLEEPTKSEKNEKLEKFKSTMANVMQNRKSP